MCPDHGEMDRDINAAANIAQKVLYVKSGTSNTTVEKIQSTRRKAKKYTKNQKEKRTSNPRDSLKYPGRDRTKDLLTPPRPKKSKSKKYCLEVNDTQCSPSNNDDCRVDGDVDIKVSDSNRTLKKQHNHNNSMKQNLLFYNV